MAVNCAYGSNHNICIHIHCNKVLTIHLNLLLLFCCSLHFQIMLRHWMCTVLHLMILSPIHLPFDYLLKFPIPLLFKYLFMVAVYTWAIFILYKPHYEQLMALKYIVIQLLLVCVYHTTYTHSSVKIALHMYILVALCIHASYNVILYMVMQHSSLYSVTLPTTIR